MRVRTSVGWVFASLLAGCEAVSVATYRASPDAAAAPAGAYTLSARHADVQFAVWHFAYSRYIARFDRFDAQLDFDPSDPTRSRLTATIDAASVDTGDPEIDAMLTGRQFFDAGSYTQIRFESRQIALTGAQTGTVEGDLTIRDVTRPVTLDVTFNGGAPNPLEPTYVLGFSATATFSRSAFGLANWLPAVGDEVAVTIEAEFEQPR
ncbi:MAG: YceI family protein [Alphaproteobacteria bacterium]